MKTAEEILNDHWPEQGDPITDLVPNERESIIDAMHEYAGQYEAILREAKDTIRSLKLSMLVHPDCEPGSEFDDLTTTAQDTENAIEAFLTAPGNNGN